MGVYIKGMDMPKGAQIIELRIYADGVVTKVHDRTCRKIAEATELPEPHGRLIDGDKAVKDYHDYGISHSYDAFDLADIIAESPTVIERSKP